MFGAAGDADVKWITDMCTGVVVREGRMPEDWCRGWMVSVGVGEVLSGAVRVGASGRWSIRVALST